MVQQTHKVNTYVSCRSSLHSNPQHLNTCLLRSTSPEVVCFHGNQAAVFDDGSHEMTSADKAGSSESPRGRMDGWMDGRAGGRAGEWWWWGGCGEKLWRERQTITSCTNGVTQPQRSSPRFPSWSALPGAEAGCDKNTVNQTRRRRDGS